MIQLGRVLHSPIICTLLCHCAACFASRGNLPAQTPPPDFLIILPMPTLEIPPEPHHLDDATLYKEFEEHPMVVVCGTVGEDEHSVGLREIINIKHGGIEKWGIKVNYLGTSVPVEKLVDAAIELNADAILASTIISHDNIHYKNMKRINDLAVEKGIRDKVIIAAGGTQVIPEDAVKTGIDAGFGRDSHGIDVATFLAEEAMRRRGDL